MLHPIDHLKKVLDLTPQQEESIRSMVEERSYRKGDRITALSDIRTHNIYITRGAARVFYVKGGKQHTFSFAFEGEFVSISVNLVDKPYSQLTIEFLEPTDVVLMPIDNIHLMVESLGKGHGKEIATMVITALLDLVRSLEERLLMLQGLSAKERYAWLLNRYPLILERATVTQIASFLGITKETLYRIRAGKYKAK